MNYFTTRALIVLVVILMFVVVVWWTIAMSGRTHPTMYIAEGAHEPTLSFGERVDLEHDLRRLAATAVASGKVKEYGIFFRDLSNGPVLGINDDVSFSPASLLKLPVALWFFKQEDERPGYLMQEIQYDGPKGISVEHYPARVSVEPGNIYTLERLIELMLVYSDNDATAILVQFAGGRERVNEVYSQLGIKSVDDYNTYTFDVRTYSAFFRVLYNAEFLSPKSSARLLNILAQSDFALGLKAGLPAGTVVAHKFGERADVHQLHDCGIVYTPKGPYSLCVMTRGGTYENLAAFIASVSEETYKAIINTQESQ